MKWFVGARKPLKEFVVDPCWRQVFDQTTSEMSFETSGLVEHTGQGCMRLVVGSPVVVIAESCSHPFVAFEDTCCSRLAWVCLGDRIVPVVDIGNSVV